MIFNFFRRPQRPTIDSFSSDLFFSRIGAGSFVKGLRLADAILYLKSYLIAEDAPTSPKNGAYTGSYRYIEEWKDKDGHMNVMMTRVGLWDPECEGEQVLMVFENSSNAFWELKDIGMRLRFYVGEPSYTGSDPMTEWMIQDVEEASI